MVRRRSAAPPRSGPFSPRLRAAAVAALLLVGGCAPAVLGTTARADHLPQATGLASWYGPGFAGRLTANGEVFDPAQLTAAHKTLPFGTRVRVVNTENGRAVVVRINDRGPFRPGRIIDLSRAAAVEIGMLGSGVAPVRLELIDAPGTVPLHAWSPLSGYQAIAPGYPVGRLLVLRSAAGGGEVLVRVIGSEVPPEAPNGLLVAPSVVAELGEAVTVLAD